MKAVLATLLSAGIFSASGIAAADDTPSNPATTRAPEPGSTAKLIHIRYGDASKIQQMLQVIPVYAKSDPDLRLIIATGKKEALATAEQIIQELDTPAASLKHRDIELTATVIAGSNAELHLDEIPNPDLAPVLKQLRAVFPYKQYAVFSSTMLRTAQSNFAQTTGLGPNIFTAGDARLITYTIAEDRATATQGSDGGNRIHLQKFDFQLRSEDLRLSTESDLDLREGQKVIVGHTNIGNRGIALFVVLSARLAD